MPFAKGNQYGKTNNHPVKHGMSGTRIYRCWADMRQRCNNPKNASYHRYGGRGIKVCEAWDEFSTFYLWAMNNGYQEDLTIDRVNNDGDYCPENCKWSTQQEQSLNKAHLPSKTGYVGVRYRANGYQAEFTRRRVAHYVGRFKTVEEAAAARAAAVSAWENGDN